MANGRPVVNLGEKYIDGLRLAWASATTITIAAGAARDADNVSDITLSSAATVDISTNGANGLDQGSVANSTMYAVYLIGDSLRSSVAPGRGIATSNPVAAGLLSTNTSSPLLPEGYDVYRRIGYVLTSGAGAILAFSQYDNGNDRWMFYDAEISELSGGNAVAFTDVDLATSVPSGAKMVRLKCTYTPAAATREAQIRPNGATAAEGWVTLRSPAAAAMILMQDVTCDDDAIIEYILEDAADALSLDVRGYVDSL